MFQAKGAISRLKRPEQMGEGCVHRAPSRLSVGARFRGQIEGDMSSTSSWRDEVVGLIPALRAFAWSLSHNGSDAGDALGVKCFVKRALNAMGYAFIDVSVSGTNVGNLMAGYGRNGLRAALMAYGSAVITDHLHNDRKSGTGFEATGGWSEAAPASWNSTGLRVRCAWHNAWLRSKLKPGARVVRCTLAPATNSSDAWATVAGQTGKNDDAAFQAARTIVEDVLAKRNKT